MNVAFAIEPSPDESPVNVPVSTSPSVLHLAVMLGVIQILDGIFTTIGINLYGISMEANPFLRHLMSAYGVEITLGLVKGLAILIIYCLYRLSNQVTWMPYALKGLIGLYLALAIVPWTLIMVQEFFL